MSDSDIIRPAEKIVGKLVALERNIATFKAAQRLFAVIDTNREHLLPWMGFAAKDKTKTAENTYNYLKNCENGWKKGDWFPYTIFENSTGECIGCCALEDVSFINKSAERGSWLAKHARGKGYAQELGALLEAECDRMGLQRIYAKIDAENTASIKNMEKCGYTLEATMLSERWCPIRQQFRDMCVYAKVKGR